MHALFILSLGAVALGGSILWGSIFHDASGASSAKKESSEPSKPARSYRGERRVAVYEFTEFDSETSV